MELITKVNCADKKLSPYFPTEPGTEDLRLLLTVRAVRSYEGLEGEGGGPAASSLSQVEIFVINISSWLWWRAGGLEGWRLCCEDKHDKNFFLINKITIIGLTAVTRSGYFLKKSGEK